MTNNEVENSYHLNEKCEIIKNNVKKTMLKIIKNNYSFLYSLVIYSVRD